MNFFQDGIPFDSLGFASTVFGKIEQRLPASVSKCLDAPLPRSWRPESLSEQIERAGRLEPVPKEWQIDPILSALGGSLSLFKRGDGEGPRVSLLRNATVLPWGIVVVDGKIHPASSTLRFLSVSRILRALPTYHDAPESRRKISQATLVSRQFVHRGTWGDYFLEFLISAAWMPQERRRTVLADCPYISKFAPRDSGALEIDLLEIPGQGIFVEELEVVGPSQLFNNFELANILRLREKFPAHPASNGPTALYLSRVGVRPEVSKLPRQIENEQEIEEFLSSEGFEILRAHEIGNHEVRSRLAAAKIVIGSWGAAMLNLAWGKPSVVIELATENAWSPTALKICDCLGVGTYANFCTKNGRINPKYISKFLATAE